METNTLLFNVRLFQRFPDIADQLYLDARVGHSKVRLIDKTQNIWCRDFMPIPAGSHFVKFKYFGREVPKSTYSFLEDVRQSPIILDGGNCQRSGAKCIITDKIFADNPRLRLSVLERTLNAEVVIIPSEPGDKLGHSDGICAFMPGTEMLLVNDYFEVPDFADYERNLLNVLNERKIEWERFPYAGHKRPDDHNAMSAWGYYINVLCVNRTVWVPQFGVEEDVEAVKFMTKALPSYTIRPIDCRAVSALGGAVHCLTADYQL